MNEKAIIEFIKILEEIKETDNNNHPLYEGLKTRVLLECDKKLKEEILND